MKKRYDKLILYIILLGIAIIPCSRMYGLGEWLTEENVSQDSSDSFLSSPGFGTNHSALVADLFGNPHIVWFGGSPSQIHYSRKTGIVWVPSATLTVGTAISRFPSLAIDTENRLHLAWHDYRHGSINNIEIYYNTTTVGGIWNNETRITHSIDSNMVNGDNSYVPTILVDHRNNLHLLWYDFHWNGFQPDLAYKSATSGFSWDTGDNFDNNRITFTEIFESPFPSLTADTASNIHVVWFDDSTGNLEIYYKSKNAITEIWSGDTLLTTDTSTSIFPVIICDVNNDLHVFWSDSRDGNFEIYGKTYSAESNSWLPDERLTNSSGESNHPAVVVDKDNNIHLVWNDNRDGNYRIYYKKCESVTQNWSQDTPISTGSGNSRHPSIYADFRGNLHVVWQDDRDGNDEIYYRQQRNATDVNKNLWSIYE